MDIYDDYLEALRGCYIKVTQKMEASDLEIFNSNLINVQPFELIDKSINKEVTILTNFGYQYTGILKGVDSIVNCILEDATETNTLSDKPVTRKHKQILVNGGKIQIILPSQPKN